MGRKASARIEAAVMTVTIIALLAASTMLSSCLTIMATPGHLMPETTEEKCAQGPHCVWLVSVYEALKDRDEASHLSEQGKFNEAKEAWRKQIALYDRTMGPDYAYTATSYWALGNITRQQGRLEESGVYYEQALGIMEKAHGPNHIDVATALDLLADVYTDDHRSTSAR
jgi:tetratricopeptide (TPR) repeat protein